MSVIVRGMEMPKNCKTCPFSDHEAWCLIPGDWRERYYCPDDERSEYCPLIELPPHGRLIDADAFENDMNTLLLPIMINKYGEEEALRGMHFSFRDHISNIQVQRTVVEAEAAAAAERMAKVKSPVIRKMVPLDHLKRCADLCISVGWTLEQFRKNMDEWEGDALDITVTG